MENINQTIVIAVIASGVLSTAINIIHEWFKECWSNTKREQKRLSEIKEDVYRKIMSNIDFIYKDIGSDDEVVKGVNNVLDTLTARPIDNATMTEKKSKIAAGMVTLRKQVVKNTKLLEKDFRHVV